MAGGGLGVERVLRLQGFSGESPCEDGRRELTLFAQSCVNLVFGYSQRHHHVRPVLGEDAEPASPEDSPSGTDLLTSLLEIGRAHV